jgi:hypothetical protein
MFSSCSSKWVGSGCFETETDLTQCLRRPARETLRGVLVEKQIVTNGVELSVVGNCPRHWSSEAMGCRPACNSLSLYRMTLLGYEA